MNDWLQTPKAGIKNKELGRSSYSAKLFASVVRVTGTTKGVHARIHCECEKYDDLECYFPLWRGGRVAVELCKDPLFRDPSSNGAILKNLALSRCKKEGMVRQHRW